MSRSQQSLRELLETLAELDYLDGELSTPEARQLAASFRECRLEFMRRTRIELTKERLHRLQQLDYRLQIVAEGQGSAETIRSEAIETLKAFGWSVPDNWW